MKRKPLNRIKKYRDLRIEISRNDNMNTELCEIIALQKNKPVLRKIRVLAPSPDHQQVCRDKHQLNKDYWDRVFFHWGKGQL